METMIGDAYDVNCPTRKVLDWIGDKWTVLILGVLDGETKRFSEIQRSISGISQKMLS